jgi:primosomal protein N' (replication factor Y)
LLDERKMFGFPPYTRIIEITVSDTYDDRAERMVGKLAAELKAHISKTAQSGPDRLTGPYSPVVDKVADQHIRTIRLSLKKDRTLTSEKEKLRKAVNVFEKENRYDGHITINVDPS